MLSLVINAGYRGGDIAEHKLDARASLILLLEYQQLNVL